MAFQAPVGTEEERNLGMVGPNGWTGDWLDANKWIGNTPPKYQLGPGNWAYHTGADLNRPGNKDKLAPIFSIGDGVVRYAKLVSKGTWGNLIVINHGIVDGKPLFSRYAHVEEIQVQQGQLVKMGTYLAKVGDQFGMFSFHLHFDISTTNKLDESPTYWPGLDLNGCKQHFVNTKDWLQQHHIVNSQPTTTTGSTTSTTEEKPPRTNIVPPLPTWYVIASEVSIYQKPSTTSEKSGMLSRGKQVFIGNEGAKNENMEWGKIIGGTFDGDWVAIRKIDPRESFLSTNRPQ